MEQALEITKIEADIAKLMAETMKLNAETSKLNAESQKLQRETRWLPAFWATAFVAAVLAVGKLFA